MPNKTLSVRDQDLPLWQRAQAVAVQRRQSLSSLVANALVEYLDAGSTITVRVYEGHGAHERVSFAGEWVVEADLDSDRRAATTSDPEFDLDPSEPRGWRAGAAITGRGRVAIYLHHWSYSVEARAVLLDFDTVDDAEQALRSDPCIPPELWPKLRSSLDEMREPVRVDI